VVEGEGTRERVSGLGGFWRPFNSSPSQHGIRFTHPREPVRVFLYVVGIPWGEDPVQQCAGQPTAFFLTAPETLIDFHNFTSSMAVSHMSAFLASIFFATVGWLLVNEDPGGREDDATVEEAYGE